MRWTLVFYAIIANKILYALSVYYGYLTSDVILRPWSRDSSALEFILSRSRDLKKVLTTTLNLTQGHKEMLQRIFKTANRRGFMVREYDLEALAENAQYDLFHNSLLFHRPLSESLTHGKSKTSRFHAASQRPQFRLTYIILCLFLIHFNQYNSLFVCLICDVLIM